MRITDKEIQQYWNRYDWFIIRWNLVSLFFILCALSPILIPVFIVLDWIDWQWWLIIFPLVIPINILLKYGFGVKGLWLFNDTKDGDFGDPAEIRKAGHENKSKLFIVIWWWLRNHSWNFNRKYVPEWEGGKGAKDFRVIKQELPEGADKFTWCSRDGIHGINYVAYRVNGQVEVRYSTANEKHQRQFGSGGNEYRFRIKNFIYAIFN